ncbi:hypothetical protein ACEPPN_012451 [Leptodophora sp. 'Broadleaf-Isolate-01']
MGQMAPMTTTPTNSVPPLPISKTCIYKVVGKISIPIDIYLPASKKDGEELDLHPVVLFIHGGGWLGSNRSDYCRPLFHEFLKLGFVVTSMDYRLRPETSLDGQLSDIRDVEYWLRNTLAAETRYCRIEVDASEIVVVGASAGAHLALMTPKLWVTKPNAILSMYGPTTLHSLHYQQRGRFSKRCSLPCTSETLAAATNYAQPPTETKVGQFGQDNYRPRSIMARHLFERGIIAEFLVKGLLRQSDGSLRLPEQGSVSKEEIDEISPLYLCKHHDYPPVYQVMGTTDDVFDTLHVHDFHAALHALAIPAEKVLVPNVLHAFDTLAEIDGATHREIVNPAVRWVAGFVGVGGNGGGE